MTLQKIDETTWFTEACPSFGSAFSLDIVEKLHEEITPFQRIEIYSTTKFGNLMVIDGCIMLTQYDNFLYHEMMSHPILFTHSNPKHVLIIGGGDCGTLREVLKHPGVENAWQVDIDEQVTRLAEIYFPELCENNHDSRAHLHFEDGIQWIKNTQEQSLDIIIVDSTDPVGPAEGLFNQAFYEDCVRALKPDGIFVQQTESPLYHQALIQDIHKAMRSAGFEKTQLLHFPQPCYPSGWWSATLASTQQSLKNFRQKDAETRSFSTRYYNEKIHEHAFATPEFLKALL